MSEPKYLILAEGKLGPRSSKTAVGLIRYKPESAAAVIDSTRSEKTVGEALGFGGGIPIVSSLEEGLKYEPNSLLIGVAPKGGRLPKEWRGIIRKAIEHGMDIVSGLHTFFEDDPEFGPLATEKGVRLWDIRRPPKNLEVAYDRWRQRNSFVVLTIGLDVNIGKMTALTEILPAIRKREPRTAFVPTGQTGILLEGEGVAVDAVVADFIAGAVEEEIMKKDAENEIILVEGQGALYHQGFSGVTLGLIHGAMPDAFLICHQPERKVNDYGLELPSYTDFIELHSKVVEPFREPKFAGIALDTSVMSEEDARKAVNAAREETGLPATDPVRFGAEPLVEAILKLKGEAVGKG